MLWAFACNGLGAPSAALGHPIVAAAAMMALAPLSVIVNSAQLRRARLARA